MATEANSILGIDCGDIIFYTWGGNMPDARESLRAIVKSRRFQEIHIVSKANSVTRLIFLARLRALNFWNYTGISRRNLHFCMHYEDKAEICASRKITHFIDDRLRVLKDLATVPHRYLLRAGGPRETEILHYEESLRGVTVVNSWSELAKIL